MFGCFKSLGPFYCFWLFNNENDKNNENGKNNENSKKKKTHIM